eukprot:COSAG06_NODE_2590_length_6610_cov_3.301183_4_plen_120_part_00
MVVSDGVDNEQLDLLVSDDSTAVLQPLLPPLPLPLPLPLVMMMMMMIMMMMMPLQMSLFDKNNDGYVDKSELDVFIRTPNAVLRTHLRGSVRNAPCLRRHVTFSRKANELPRQARDKHN